MGHEESGQQWVEGAWWCNIPTTVCKRQWGRGGVLQKFK